MYDSITLLLSTYHVLSTHKSCVYQSFIKQDYAKFKQLPMPTVSPGGVALTMDKLTHQVWPSNGPLTKHWSYSRQHMGQ